MGKGSLLFWGFRPPRELLRARLGTLERQVIDIVWTGDEVTVRDVHARLDGRVAYTTVMTTLDRLFRKGLLARNQAGPRLRVLGGREPRGIGRDRRQRRRVRSAGRGVVAAPVPLEPR